MSNCETLFSHALFLLLKPQSCFHEGFIFFLKHDDTFKNILLVRKISQILNILFLDSFNSLTQNPSDFVRTWLGFPPGVVWCSNLRLDGQEGTVIDGYCLGHAFPFWYWSLTPTKPCVTSTICPNLLIKIKVTDLKKPSVQI